ncbi:DNAse I-like superfamily protein, partial [Striga hermonthica]
GILTKHALCRLKFNNKFWESHQYLIHVVIQLKLFEALRQRLEHYTPFFQLKEKVKNTRVALFIWSSSFRTQNQTTIADLTQKLEDLNADRSDMNWEEWGSTKSKLNKAHAQEEIFWQQKAKHRWLKEGDANTKFFHAFTLQRRKLNAITRLINNQGKVLSSQKDLEKHISDFYSGLFSSEGCWGGDSILPLIPRSITTEMNNALLRPVEKEEVKSCLFSLNPDKSPGEDGMTAAFYQHFWLLIEDDIVKAVLSFFHSGMILKYWNHTVVSLIPKCPNPKFLSQFRPISLCTVIYKIISKLLALRLKACLPNCVSDYQAAFLEGRQLTDNVIVAQEAFHYLNRHVSGPNFFMALKLDLIKAFDRVEWLCLKKIMIQMGFDHRFVKLIMLCVSTASFSFKVNGSVNGYVSPSRGIRQRDLLSPYLFIIVAELLTAIILHSISSGLLKGMKISRNGPLLSHLLFADDSLLFCKAGVDQAGIIISILEQYRLFTGQTVNLNKSAIFFSKNTPQYLQNSIYRSLNGITPHKSTRYLGLPLGIGKSKKEVFDYLLASVRNKLTSWNSKLLSSAGKEVLLKAVIQALSVFTMSCFILPVSICSEIARLSAKFWWKSGTNQSTGVHWKKWNSITVPKDCGGMAFHDLQLFNKALICKQLWRIASNPDLLQYRLFTGQTVNLNKSAIFFSKNTPQHLQNSICRSLNGITSHKSTRYLGLPLGIGKSKKEVFNTSLLL